MTVYRHVRLPVAAALLVAALAGTGAGSCGSDVAGQRCSTDVQCPDEYVCMIGTCLPRGMGRTVAIEILPRTDSTAARTGIPNVALGPGQIALAADDRIVVEGTVTNAPNARVILLVASSIPGQADLQFEAELANFKFQIGVGTRLIKSRATLSVIPNVENQQQPPVSFDTMLDASLNFTYPPAADLTVMSGTFHDADGLPPTGQFFARAVVDGRVVSNVDKTDDQGAYDLLIAPATVPANSPAMMTVDFTPVDVDDVRRFQTTPFSFAAAAAAGVVPRRFRIPDSMPAIPVRFLVQSSDKGGVPLGDVTLRFRTTIVADVEGLAIYEREIGTDDMGEAMVYLLPGTADEPRAYEIAIVPPPDSLYATKCIGAHPVVIGESDFLEANTFRIDPKVMLRGKVLANDLSPAATVSVTATQLPISSECANATSASPVSSTTVRTGDYEMLVNPGTYRLEMDPPIGSPVPRLSQDGDSAVVVSADPVTTHDVILPPGEVIEGDVKGVGDMPLSSASIRIFQVLCQGDNCTGPRRIPPALRAQTRTDMSGHFRAVLPLP